MLKKLSATFKISLAMMFAVLSSGFVPAYAYAAQPGNTQVKQSSNATLLPVWCQDTGNGWKANQGTGDNQNRTALMGLFSEEYGTVTQEDIDNNTYPTATLGQTLWMNSSGQLNESILDNACKEQNEEPINYCNPAPARGSVADWVPTDVDCVTFEIVKTCGVLDAEINNLTPYEGWAVSWSVGSPDYNYTTSLPADFEEDYNGGSVEVYYWLTGPEGDYVKGRSHIPNYWDGNAKSVTVNTNCEEDEEPQYFLKTGHDLETCGEVTISLRNKSPWMYRVLIEQKKADGTWERVAATAGDPQWQVVPGVMEIDNRGDTVPDDRTGNYVVQYDEDEVVGVHPGYEVRYRVSSGTESDLYANLPVGQFTYVNVRTDCLPNYLETSHNSDVCGQVTISLRNVSPWRYYVLIEQKNSNGDWERVATSNPASPWQAAPGVMWVDNLDDEPNDRTGTYTVAYGEHTGVHEVRYKVSSGTENDLFVGKPIGEYTPVQVDSNCLSDEDFYCNPTPAQGSVANWVPEGVNCVEFTVDTTCGEVTPRITNLTQYDTWAVAYSEGAPDWNYTNLLPKSFDEDYNGGSVDVHYWLVGPEEDYILDRGINNFWEERAGMVTVDTDCEGNVLSDEDSEEDASEVLAVVDTPKVLPATGNETSLHLIGAALAVLTYAVMLRRQTTYEV